VAERDLIDAARFELADEIDGEALMAGEWFVAARASLPDRS